MQRALAIVGVCIVGCLTTGGLAAVQLNAAEGFSWAGAFDDPAAWLQQAPNPWLLLSSLTSTAFAMLGAWAAIAQLRAKPPPDEKTITSIVQREGGEIAGQIHAEGKASEDRDAAISQELAALRALTEKLVAAGRATPDMATSMTTAVTELVRSDDARDAAIGRQAIEGDPVAAADRLMAEMEAGKRRNAERARQAARIYAPFAPSKAMAAYKEAVDLDPDDVWSWIELGRLRRHYEGLDSARRCFDAALQVVTDARDRSVLDNEIGSLEFAAGDLGAARDRYAAGLTIAERLAAREPGNSEWQRDLSISHNKLGDVERAAGDLGAARDRYAASLTIRERLAAREPGNSEWQRDLSISHNKLGDVERAAGDLGAARDRYAASLTIAERLAAREPGNSEWQRDLFISHAKLAQLAEAEGGIGDAVAAFGRAEAIMAALSERWPDHPGFARDHASVRADLTRLGGG